jgi:hypothetical protein
VKIVLFSFLCNCLIVLQFYRDSHECKKASNEDRTKDKVAKSISIKSLIYDSILSTNDSNNTRTSNYEENNKSNTPINRLFGDSNHSPERDGYVWGSLELRTEVRKLIMSVSMKLILLL